MKKNIYDSALDGVSEIIEAVSESISKEFKGANPFDKEPISDDEMLNEYNTMTPEILSERITREGEEATNEYIRRMEELKGRKLYA